MLSKQCHWAICYSTLQPASRRNQSPSLQSGLQAQAVHNEFIMPKSNRERWKACGRCQSIAVSEIWAGVRTEIEYYAMGVNGSYFACAAACLQMEINK